MELITPIEKEQKKEKRKEINSQSKEFYEELRGKFQGCLAISTLKKNFSLGELSKLNEIDFNLEEINQFSKPKDKVVRLKAKLIPIDEILKIAREIIKRDGFCLIQDLDEELQKVYIVNGRTKTVYLRFLVDIFRDKLSNDFEIEYIHRKWMGKKNVTNILILK
jgi:hypothetical protein